jgi:argininosuccinate synthase
VTIGGRETLTSDGSIPEEAWVLSREAFTHPAAAERHTIDFLRGVPTALDHESLDPVALIERVETIGAKFGVGRGIHLGDTIIGTKGRVAFEAPAAHVLIEAHRELEKLVLTGRQQRLKDTVAGPYGDLVHEGQHLDPVCRDIEALLESSQSRVTGSVQVLYRPGIAFVEGVASPHSLMTVSKGVYGEAPGEWTAADALGFSKMLSLTGSFWHRAGTEQALGPPASSLRPPASS